MMSISWTNIKIQQLNFNLYIVQQKSYWFLKVIFNWKYIKKKYIFNILFYFLHHHIKSIQIKKSKKHQLNFFFELFEK
jgi:hypothetical protein